MKKALPFLLSGIITAALMATISFFITDTLQSRSTLVSGLIFGIVLIAIPIYDINRWSLMKRSIIHFFLMLATVLPLLLYSRWFSPLVSVGVFVLFGIVGWTTGYAVSKLKNRTSARH